MQAKLLRVFAGKKQVRPVGALAPKRSDFRIIAATNRDLAKEVDRGTFRRDLYYRLNVVNLKIAPLRERREDITNLIDHFMCLYGGSHRMAQEALDALATYDWPGNVRELENCIQNMVAVHTGPLLTVSDLPSSIQNHLLSKRYRSAAAVVGSFHALPSMPPPSAEKILPITASVPYSDSPVLPLVELEKRAIRQALEYTRGDRGVAPTCWESGGQPFIAS